MWSFSHILTLEPKPWGRWGLCLSGPEQNPQVLTEKATQHVSLAVITGHDPNLSWSVCSSENRDGNNTLMLVTQ